MERAGRWLKVTGPEPFRILDVSGPGNNPAVELAPDQVAGRGVCLARRDEGAPWRSVTEEATPSRRASRSAT